MLINIKNKFLSVLNLSNILITYISFSILPIIIIILSQNLEIIKEHQEFDILFFIHAIISLFVLVLFTFLLVYLLIFLLTDKKIIVSLIKKTSKLSIFLTIFSLLTGTLWGTFSWGNSTIFDTKIIILFLILFINTLILIVPITTKLYKYVINAIILFSLPS